MTALGRARPHPLLYQVNTRVVLGERAAALGRPATLDDLEDRWLDDVAALGFDWVWLLGVWQTGEAGRAVARADAGLRARLRAVLPDLREDDVVSSPFAVREYHVHRDFGGDAALARARERLARRGLRLLLDFVPNHTALDHRWVTEHPAYYVHGSDEDLARQPQNYVRMLGRPPAILAHGRDPYFDGWSDTLQLDYRHAGLREAMIAELGGVADRCDGVRCDMAMLLEPEVIRRTWGERARPADGSPPRDTPFWPEAIAAIRRRRPDFLFVAEVYWDMEWQLQQHGFDFTYDKRLYDRLHGGEAVAAREHLLAIPAYQDRSLRFLENHDEPRAAAAFAPGQLEAAAVVTFLPHGLRFFHEGQLEGRRAQIAMQLARRPAEPADERVRDFYRRLLAVLRRPEVHDGTWRLETARQAWAGNPTHAQLVAMSWESPSPAGAGGGRRLLAVANYGPTHAQGYVTPSFGSLGGRTFTLFDLLGDASYDRSGDELATRGLYLDLQPWGRHVFTLEGR